MLSKLRPVGSHVPLPTSDRVLIPWEGNYEAEYFASGTDALAMAVKIAVARKPELRRPEVIIPGYGCPDLIAAVVCGGAQPVLIDVVDDSPFLDCELLLAGISDATVAIVAVGFLGIPERLDKLSAICSEYDFYLIEDSAQCFPPASCSRAIADLVVLSFGRGKPINLMGGGALLYADRLSDESKRAIEKHPKETGGYGRFWNLKRIAFNLLLERLFFALMEKIPFLGIGTTKFTPHFKITRRDIPETLLWAGITQYGCRPLVHQWYDHHFLCLERLGWKAVIASRGNDCSLGADTPRLRYGVLAPSQVIRDNCVTALNSAGIAANDFYGNALCAIPGVADLIDSANLPSAENFASRLLTLPCHEDVTPQDVRLIVDILEEISLFYGKLSESLTSVKTSA